MAEGKTTDIRKKAGGALNNSDVRLVFKVFLFACAGAGVC